MHLYPLSCLVHHILISDLDHKSFVRNATEIEVWYEVFFEQWVVGHQIKKCPFAHLPDACYINVLVILLHVLGPEDLGGCDRRRRVHTGFWWGNFQKKTTWKDNIKVDHREMGLADGDG